MKCNFVCVKIKDKNNLNNGKIQEIFNLSIENKRIYLNYNKNKKDYSKQNMKIIYYKKFIKKNIGQMIYKTNESNQEIKIFNETFIENNMKRAKIIIKNKQYDLKENIKSENKIFKIEIKFIDNIIRFYLLYIIFKI